MSRFFGLSFKKIFSSHDIFTDDLRKSAYTQNPTIIPEIDLVWVLSGRSTVFGEDADHLQRDFDRGDDIARLQEGLRIARAVNALRAGKHPDLLKPEDMVTPILINGRAIHNSHIKIALDKGLINYPAALFIIRDIKPENTIGQVQSFKNYLSKPLYKHQLVAVVSSAYHGPRVLRTLGEESPQVRNQDEDKHPILDLNLLFYGVHKNEKRIGMIEDLNGEHQAMMRYSSGENPSIARVQSKNTFFTDEDFMSERMFKRAQYWAINLFPQPQNPDDFKNSLELMAVNAIEELVTPYEVDLFSEKNRKPFSNKEGIKLLLLLTFMVTAIYSILQLLIDKKDDGLIILAVGFYAALTTEINMWKDDSLCVALSKWLIMDVENNAPLINC